MESREVDIGGTTLVVREWGRPDERPAVFWHGLGDRSGLSIGAIAPNLGLRVVGLDAPGFGGSPPLEPEGYLLSSLGELGLRLIATLGLHRPLWLGESWGGHVGVWLGATHPESIGALVLLDGGYRDVTEFDGMDVHEIAEVVGSRTLATAMWAVRRKPSWQALPLLGESELPVLLLAATDPPQPERDAALAQFEELVPQATVVRLEGAGHVVVDDAPEAVATAVVGWLRSL
jgi:pimeloyl-ACP methyl ester carboxylesterase